MRIPGDKPVAGFICSHPKSGRTWMRFALARYLSQVYVLDLEVSLQTMWTILPNHDGGNEVAGRELDNYAYFDRGDVPLILSSHLPFDSDVFDGLPVAFIVRSPYDVIVSFFFQKTKTERSWSGELKQFIRDPEFGIHALVGYWNSWASRLLSNGDLTLSYEGLRADPVAGFTQLIRHLNLREDGAAVDDAIEYSSVDNMRRIELERGVINLSYDQSDPDALRVRRAVIGGYHDYLDEEDQSYIHEIVRSKLSQEAKLVLQRHGIAY